MLFGATASPGFSAASCRKISIASLNFFERQITRAQPFICDDVIGPLSNRLLVGLNLFVGLAPITIDQAERVISVGRVVRIESDRLPVRFRGVFILLEIKTREPDVEVRLSRRSQADSFLRRFQRLSMSAEFLVAETSSAPTLPRSYCLTRQLSQSKASAFSQSSFERKLNPSRKN